MKRVADGLLAIDTERLHEHLARLVQPRGFDLEQLNDRE